MHFVLMFSAIESWGLDSFECYSGKKWLPIMPGMRGASWLYCFWMINHWAYLIGVQCHTLIFPVHIYICTQIDTNEWRYSYVWYQVCYKIIINGWGYWVIKSCVSHSSPGKFGTLGDYQKYRWIWVELDWFWRYG